MSHHVAISTNVEASARLNQPRRDFRLVRKSQRANVLLKVRRKSAKLLDAVSLCSPGATKRCRVSGLTVSLKRFRTNAHDSFDM